MRSPARNFVVALTLLACVSLVGAACSKTEPGTTAAGPGGTSGGGAAAASEFCLNFNDLYALVGPESNDVKTWKDATKLASELGSKTAFPDGDLTITAPGQESGTYDSFYEIALEKITKERVKTGKVVPDKDGSDKPKEKTRKDYPAQSNDNAIIAGMKSRTSFGWVGFAVAQEAGTEVAILTIDGGKGCVSPDAKTIADGSYPLSRSLYIYVNKAKAQANTAIQEYVWCYLNDCYPAVEDVGYVALPADQLDKTRKAWTDAGFSKATGANGKLRISGSSTVEPISQAVKDEVTEENDKVSVDLDGPGTTDGFKLFCKGETDISDASRAITEAEKTACKDAGVDWIELKVGFDGIAVMTSPENPAIKK